MADGVDKLKRCVKNTHTSMYSDISQSVEDNMEKFTEELFSRSIISTAVRKSKNYSKVTDEFWAGLPWKKTAKDIERHCVLFLESLQAIGPTGIGAADQLGKKWKEDVYKNLGIPFLSEYMATTSTDTSKKSV